MANIMLPFFTWYQDIAKEAKQVSEILDSQFLK